MRAKSWFISLDLMLATAGAAWAIAQILSLGLCLSAVGVLLLSAPILGFVGFAMIFKNVARTSEKLPVLLGAGAVGLALVMAGSMVHGPNIPALGLGFANAAGLLAYIYWYSVFGRQPAEALQIGRQLPNFVLEEENGTPVDVGSLRGRPVLFMFYRGNWCPLCMAQIKEVAAAYGELERRGVQVIAVSPQPHGHTESLARKFDVNIRFLVDVNNRVARELGIAATDGQPAGMEALGYDQETVLPTVVIADEEGRVLWRHETDNYRVRPEPQLFLDVLDGRAPVGPVPRPA